MKKRIVTALMTAIMAMSLTACGVSSSGGIAVDDKSVSDVKVGLVTDIAGVNDGSFNQSAWAGLQQAEEELGITVNYLESATDADYTPNIETFVDEEYDLIICVGYMLADAVETAASANPDIRFAIIDYENIDLDNVTCLMFRQEQASYLAGYAAGLMTKTDNVGIVIGMANDNMHLFGYGYAAGAVDANPDITVQQYNANSFGDAVIGKTTANTAITNGADIVFHAAGATGLGVIEACQEAGVYAIGVDSDQSVIAPDTVITSAMKRVDVAVIDTVKNFLNHTLESGIKRYDLSAEGVDIAPAQDLLSTEVITKIEEVKTKIVSGEITVPSNREEFEAKYGRDLYVLD